VSEATLEARAAALRAVFDRSFALPPAEASEDRIDLLAIRVAGTAYAVRAHQLAGVVARPAVTPVPSRAAHLLGLAGVRGAIVPVFSLASLLGHGDARTPPGWLLLCHADELIGLGCAGLERYLRAPRSSFHAEAPTPGVRGLAREVVRTDAGVLPLVAVPAVIATLRSLAGQPRPAEEQ
jgi:purine-binding chemotaxis protein CheW